VIDCDCELERGNAPLSLATGLTIVDAALGMDGFSTSSSTALRRTVIAFAAAAVAAVTAVVAIVAVAVL